MFCVVCIGRCAVASDTCEDIAHTTPKCRRYQTRHKFSVAMAGSSKNYHKNAFDRSDPAEELWITFQSIWREFVVVSYS